MSCPEVVYQAYYPYLYQRPATSASSVARTAPFPPFSHQYDRLNVQRPLEPQAEFPSHHSNAGSVSSGGGVGSPESPPRHKDEATDEEDDEPRGRQYVSTKCVVLTHYEGDVSKVVDQHFARALGCKGKESPMATRNFPPSFWNSSHQPAYSDYSDPWHQHYQQYHHRAVHEYHHQYGGLLLPPTRLPHPQYGKGDWAPQGLDPGYTAYPGMAGLEAPVQETSKDLYWF